MPKLLLAAAAFIAFVAFPLDRATAVEPLTSEEFASHCRQYRVQPDGADGIFCVRYIQGFIDGAVATDERVTLNVATEYEQEETFVQRAIRTRVGQQLESYGSSYYAEFCLGAPIPLAEVVDHIVSRLEQSGFKTDVPLARNLVYDVLQEDYPCKPDGSASQ